MYDLHKKKKNSKKTTNGKFYRKEFLMHTQRELNCPECHKHLILFKIFNLCSLINFFLHANQYRLVFLSYQFKEIVKLKRQIKKKKLLNGNRVLSLSILLIFCFILLRTTNIKLKFDTFFFVKISFLFIDFLYIFLYIDT